VVSLPVAIQSILTVYSSASCAARSSVRFARSYSHACTVPMVTSRMRLTLCWVRPADSLAVLSRSPTLCNAFNDCLQVLKSFVGGAYFIEGLVELNVSYELSDVGCVEVA